MEIKTVRALWFSPTGNAERAAVTIARTVAERLGIPLETFGLNRPEARKREYVFKPTDFLVVACPVYAGKLPNKILPDLTNILKGSDTPAAAVVTFGNRAFDNALAELVTLLSGNGFYPVGAGAFVTKLGGSFENVMGFPVNEVEEMLSHFLVKSENRD